MELIFEDSYEEARKGAKSFYAKVGRVSCSVLNGETVVFNSIGFRHLLRGRGVFRPRAEQRRRFALLPYAVNMIKNPGTRVVYQPRMTTHLINWRGKKTLVASRVDFWIFTAKQRDRVIKVIVRQFRGKEKHFFSVYEIKQKSALCKADL